MKTSSSQKLLIRSLLFVVACAIGPAIAQTVDPTFTKITSGPVPTQGTFAETLVIKTDNEAESRLEVAIAGYVK